MKKLFSNLALTAILVSAALSIAPAVQNGAPNNPQNHGPVITVTTTKNEDRGSSSKSDNGSSSNHDNGSSSNRDNHVVGPHDPNVKLSPEELHEDVDPEYLKKKMEYYKKLSESQKGHSNVLEEHKKELQSFDNYHQQSKDWIKKLTEAKTQQQYEEILKGYNALMVTFKDKFKGCMPPPPPSPIHIDQAPEEDDCHKGYKVGWKEGENWANIVTRDQGSFMDGETKMQCLMDWMKKKSGSVYHLCSIRGAKAGYAKWWNMLQPKNEKDLKNFKKLEEDEKEAIRQNIAYYKKLALKLD